MCNKLAIFQLYDGQNKVTFNDVHFAPDQLTETTVCR